MPSAISENAPATVVPIALAAFLATSINLTNLLAGIPSNIALVAVVINDIVSRVSLLTFFNCLTNNLASTPWLATKLLKALAWTWKAAPISAISSNFLRPKKAPTKLPITATPTPIILK